LLYHIVKRWKRLYVADLAGNNIALSIKEGDTTMPQEFDLVTSVTYLRDNNCNVAMEFTEDKDGYLLFNLRATPWRNSANNGNMILVSDYNVEDALIRLAECVDRREWTPLNWRVRMNEPGSYSPGKSWALLRPAGDAPDNLQDGRQAAGRTDHTDSKPKGR